MPVRSLIMFGVIVRRLHDIVVCLENLESSGLHVDRECLGIAKSFDLGRALHVEQSSEESSRSNKETRKKKKKKNAIYCSL